MPTFKHPCPHCGTFINRDVAACPACGRADPFAPARCPNCRTAIEDATWVACPRCGQPVGAAAEAAAAAAKAGATSAPSSASPTARAPSSRTPVASGQTPLNAAEPEARHCTGCGAPLPAGARFCRECGTAASA